jgi:hypothetical protein
VQSYRSVGGAYASGTWESGGMTMSTVCSTCSRSATIAATRPCRRVNGSVARTAPVAESTTSAVSGPVAVLPTLSADGT